MALNPKLKKLFNRN